MKSECKYDVLVAGGGFTGFAAAVAAARENKKVLLVEKGNCMGGAASINLVLPFMNYSTVINGQRVALSRGIFREFTEQFQKMRKEIDQVDYKDEFVSTFSEEYVKVILNRMAMEAGVSLLYNSYVSRVYRQKDTIEKVGICGIGGELEIQADYVVDATGDGNIAFLAGFPYRLGRNEDHLCQPMTLCFRLANVDPEVCKNLPRAEINELYQKFQAQGSIKNPRENVLIFGTLTDRILHFNSTRIVKLNPTDPFELTKAEIDAREQVMELFLFMKRNIKGFENCQLLMTAAEIGIRESRMVEGEYTLTGNDIRQCIQFDDSIALGNYDIDIHNPEGGGTSHYYFKPGEFYSIPYRCLIPKNAKNLLVAGRCISVDHDAQASIRIMPIVCTIGQAAGTAAALAAEGKCGVKDIDVSRLQSILTMNGAAIRL